MRTLKYLVAVMLLTSVALTSCDMNKFDAPAMEVPKYTGSPANTTIKALKDANATAIAGIPYKFPEGTPVIIKAVVTANDKSGNLFKKMTIQDETGGIDIAVNQYNLSNIYHVGQTVYLDCAGLYIGGYGGQAQIGELRNDGTVGQMLEFQLSSHISLDGVADIKKLPAIPTVTMEDLKSTKAADLTGILVRFEKVTFDGVNRNGDVFATNAQDMQRNLKLSTGENIIVRTSAFASFAKTKLPKGIGTVVTLLGNFKGTWQLTIVQTSDLTGFTW